jgi:hypothetical protein
MNEIGTLKFNKMGGSKKPTERLTFTYFMEQSPSWEANQSAASQEILRIFLLRDTYSRNTPPPPEIRVGE